MMTMPPTYTVLAIDTITDNTYHHNPWTKIPYIAKTRFNLVFVDWLIDCFSS
jgi:hypothetical protein